MRKFHKENFMYFIFYVFIVNWGGEKQAFFGILISILYFCGI